MSLSSLNILSHLSPSYSIYGLKTTFTCFSKINAFLILWMDELNFLKTDIRKLMNFWTTISFDKDKVRYYESFGFYTNNPFRLWLIPDSGKGEDFFCMKSISILNIYLILTNVGFLTDFGLEVASLRIWHVD